MQGKLFERCSHLLYCSILSLGCKVNKRRMSQPDMGSIFHIKKSMKYSGPRKLLCELSKLNAFILLGYIWCIYSCLQIPPRENWFQYVRRVYETVIKFPCIITLYKTLLIYKPPNTRTSYLLRLYIFPQGHQGGRLESYRGNKMNIIVKTYFLKYIPAQKISE